MPETCLAARAQIKEVLQKYLGADDDLYDLNLTAKCASCICVARRLRFVSFLLTLHANSSQSDRPFHFSLCMQS